MERNNLIAILLIGLVFMGYMWWTTENAPPKKNTNALFQDSTITGEPSESNVEPELKDDSPVMDSLGAADKFGRYFSQFAFGEEKIYTIETDLYIAKFTSHGANLVEFTLKDYTKWDGVPSQLIWEGDKQLFLDFLSVDGRPIDSRELYFEIVGEDSIRVRNEETAELTAILKIGDNQYIKKNFKFYGNEYIFDHNIELAGLDKVIKKNGYDLNWANGVKYQEYRSDMESNYAEVVTSANGELIDLDASDYDEEYKEKVSGNIDFASVKSKYFQAAIIPNNFDGDVQMIGVRKRIKDKGFVEHYNVSIQRPYEGGNVKHQYKVYVGPLDYDIVSQYGMSETVNLGWWIFRYIGEYLLMPFFLMLHSFIPNWGFTIIIFSIALKLILMPLSKGQLESSRKMKLLAPEIAKIREKYADNAQKQQQETMALYGQYGVNPMGGCFPMLLQMPILYTLWTVFSTNIHLRQAEFGLWINDLSMPDYILTLPFSIMGFESLSGLALAMSVTMFIQQKMTISDPKQKAMVYMMPLLFMFMFSNFPSGLNLYYFMFNILGIIQQVYVNYFQKNQISLVEMRKSPKKEGFFTKKMKEMQQIAEAQQKSKNGNPVNPNKRKRKNK